MFPIIVAPGQGASGGYAMTFKKALTIGAIAVGSVIVLSMVSPWFRNMLLFGGGVPAGPPSGVSAPPVTTPGS